MNPAAPVCSHCLVLQDDFLTALQGGRKPEIADFVSRHPEHADVLKRALQEIIAIHGAILPRCFHPPGVLQTTVALQNNGTLLGRGGQAEVHSFTDTKWNCEVAVKFPRGDRFAIADPVTREAIEQRFWREAQIASRLDHPGVAPIFAGGVCERPVLSRQLIGGDDHESTPSGALESTSTLAVPSDGEQGSNNGSGWRGDLRLPTYSTSQECCGNHRWPFYIMRRIRGETWEKRVASFSPSRWASDSRRSRISRAGRQSSQCLPDHCPRAWQRDYPP
jgi:hypothetical protein